MIPLCGRALSRRRFFALFLIRLRVQEHGGSKNAVLPVEICLAAVLEGYLAYRACAYALAPVLGGEQAAVGGSLGRVRGMGFSSSTVMRSKNSPARVSRRILWFRTSA